MKTSTIVILATLPVLGLAVAMGARAQSTAPSTHPSGTSSSHSSGHSSTAASASQPGSTARGQQPTSRNFATSLPARPPGFARRNTPSLPKEYAVLTERSLFKKGRVRSAEQDMQENSNRDRFTPKPQASLLFTGVADALAEGSDGVSTVFVENTNSSSVQRLKNGDTIAGGKVTKITIESFDYELDGHTKTIYLGQFLDGSGYKPPMATSTDPNQQSSGATYAPGSVAERMRLARMKAMGQLPAEGGATTAPSNGTAPGGDGHDQSTQPSDNGPQFIPVPVPDGVVPGGPMGGPPQFP